MKDTKMIVLRITEHERYRNEDDCERGVSRAVSWDSMRLFVEGHRALLHIELDGMIDAMERAGAFK